MCIKKTLAFLLFMILLVLMLSCKASETTCGTYYSTTTFAISPDKTHKPFLIKRESWFKICDTLYIAAHRNYSSTKYYTEKYSISKVTKKNNAVIYRIDFPIDSLKNQRPSLIIRKVKNDLYFYEDLGSDGIRGPELIVLNLVEVGL